MAYQHHIGFLGYGQLTQMLQEILPALRWTDTVIEVLNSTADTLQICVEQGRQKGCEVFVGGSANAAEFARQGQGHLVEIPIQDIDYLTALQSALEQGHHPAIVLYQHAKRPDIAVYERLLGSHISLLTYEDAQDMKEKIAQTACDSIVGASHALEVAQKLGKAGILLYPGKASIMQTLEKARDLARQLHQEQKSQAILRSIVNNSTFGVVVCDTKGEITLFNRAAQRLTNLSGQEVRGQYIDQLFPTLKTARFLSGDQEKQDGWHLIQDTMFRCIQTKIRLRGEGLGVLTTFYMDSRSRKYVPTAVYPERTARATFSDWAAHRPGLEHHTRQARAYARSALNLIVVGETGSGREWLAQCIHNATFEESRPYVRINFAAFSGQDAGQCLLGGQNDRDKGVLAFADQGTAVLEHLDQAPPQAISCLIDVMRYQRLLRPGTVDSTPVHIRFITLVTPEELERLPPVLRTLAGILVFALPPLRDQRQDVPALFLRFLRQHEEQGDKQEKLSQRMERLLLFYDWPGNLDELSAVCQRYLFAVGQETACTQATKYRLLVKAIGEESLLQALLRQYPALTDPTAEAEAFQAGIAVAKDILGYRNTILAEKLGMSRTTLWRKLSSATPPAP
ncbi:MAG: PrpR N-terminal domain-containing protein [Eubacteriales bacterium]|nr:PrpR N-terminal domain-containing protein [Eubacteriales bacterium]